MEEHMSENRILFVDCGAVSKTHKDFFSKTEEESWSTLICCKGSEAEKALGDDRYDICISDIHLPDIDGMEFFRTVRDNYPGTIRVMETDNRDHSFLIKASELAHLVVSPDCAPQVLSAILENSLQLRKILGNQKLHERISSIKALPSPPEMYKQLMEELQQEDYSMHRVAEIIKSDIAITAKLLQLINSAFFGLQTHVESPLHAVNLLGINVVKNIVLTSGIFQKFHDPNIPGFSAQSIYQRSIAIGAGARHLANAFGFSTRDVEDSLLAGMLHDIGKLIMLTYFTEELSAANELANKEQITLFEAEREVLGVTDAELGAHLLSLWNIPLTILEAVAFHYEPRRSAYPIMNILTPVHLSYAINNDIIHNVRDDSKSHIDYAYIDRFSLRDNIPNLKNFCLAASEH